MTCPECGGKGYVELFISSVPCSLCATETIVEPEVDAAPRSWAQVQERRLAAFKKAAREQSTEQLERKIHDLAQAVGPVPAFDFTGVGRHGPWLQVKPKLKPASASECWSDVRPPRLQGLTKFDELTPAQRVDVLDEFTRELAESGAFERVVEALEAEGQCAPGLREDFTNRGLILPKNSGGEEGPNEEWVDGESTDGAIGGLVFRDGRRGKILSRDPARFRYLVRWDEQHALPENSEWVEIETLTCLFEVGERVRYAGRYARVLEVEPGGGRMLVRWEESAPK